MDADTSEGIMFLFVNARLWLHWLRRLRIYGRMGNWEGRAGGEGRCISRKVGLSSSLTLPEEARSSG